MFVIFARKQEKIWKKSIVKLLHYLKVVKKIDRINMGKNLEKCGQRKVVGKNLEKTLQYRGRVKNEEKKLKKS